MTEPRALGFAMLLLVLGGCRSAPLALPRSAGATACVRPRLDADSPYRLFLAGPVDDPELRARLEQLPPELRGVVRATGLEPLVGRILRARSEPSTPPIALLSMRQELTAHLGALGSQLTSLSSELDCTDEATEEILHAYEDRAHARELKLTIASLVVGALGGVAAGVWDAADEDSKAPAIVGATSAGVTAALGTAAFIPRERSVTYMHARNLLAPIARGDDPEHLYPTFVFRLLTTPRDADGTTPRDALLAHWEELLRDEVRGPEARAVRELLYGPGGVYEERILRLRESMFDQLVLSVNALSRELELLERYLARLW